MQIVIEIPEEYYNAIKEISDENSTIDMLLIKYGKPLPKGHGRLIDANKLKDDSQTMTEWNGDVFRCVTERVIDFAPTIIEADKED